MITNPFSIKNCISFEGTTGALTGFWTTFSDDFIGLFVDGERLGKLDSMLGKLSILGKFEEGFKGTSAKLGLEDFPHP